MVLQGVPVKGYGYNRVQKLGMDSVKLSYAQLEATLGRYLNVHPDRTSTFRSRLKQLQRLEFPPGVNIGRGVRMTYSATHVLQLAAAFELIGLGLPAGQATSMVIEHWPKFEAAFGRVHSSAPDDKDGTYVVVTARSPIEPPSGWKDNATVEETETLFAQWGDAKERAARIVIDAKRLFKSINRFAHEVGREPYPNGSPEYRQWAEARNKRQEVFDNTDGGGIPF